jgi:hypothetical protein
MKRKTNLSFSFFIAVFAVMTLVSGCDMDPFSAPAVPQPDVPQPDGFDSSIPCLTIINLPANTRKNHFSNVFVFNSAGVVSKCADYDQITIIKDNGFVTAKIPLSYNTDSGYFKETGTFIVSFTANIDYATYYIVKESEKLRLYFTDGCATFDASLIPPPPPPYLTIISLPADTRSQNISNVFVYNDAGTVIAKCADYDQIIITRDSLSVTAKVPLYYSGRDEHFTDTGNFVVSLFVNINFATQIIVKEEDKFTLPFTEGNALLDASLIPPAPPPPYLTITSLPKNVKPQNFSNVFAYNSIGTAAAECADYDQIIITAGSDYAAAMIPLVYTGSGEPFRDSGYFYVSFSLYINSYIDISKTRDDEFPVPFTDGSGTFNFLNNALASIELGYFSGGLTNPLDTAAPVIRSGTKFEMNGFYYTANSNMAVAASSFSNTCIVYVYARLVFNQLEFIYSTAAPVYDNYKKGYYNGFARALFKFVFIRDSSNKYFAKIFINDGWSHLRYQTVDSSSLASQNLFQHYYLSGTADPHSHTVTLPAGAYLFTLNGAAGASSPASFEFRPSSAPLGPPVPVGPGGSGGHVSEVVILSQNTSFTFFTGENGKQGTRNSGTTSSTVAGGRGGCGSFAFSPDGYFLCAGGGGGALGLYSSSADSIFVFNPNNPNQLVSVNPVFHIGGGAGGSIGGGGAGGSSNGGNGGGVNGGIESRKYGYSDLTVYSYSPGFNGASVYSNGWEASPGGSAAYFNLPSPYSWLNTNNANGRGGSNTENAQSGGNNRNSVRGGGGTPNSSSSTLTNGSITVFKIN